MPTCGFKVVNGYAATAGFAFEMARSSEDLPALGNPTCRTGGRAATSSVCARPRAGRVSGPGTAQGHSRPGKGGGGSPAGRRPSQPWTPVSLGPPPAGPGDAHQASVGHRLQLQREDPLLSGLPGGAGEGRAVVVGQEEAVALPSGPAQGGDVLVPRVRQVGHHLVPLLHYRAHGDLGREAVTVRRDQVCLPSLRRGCGWVGVGQPGVPGRGAAPHSG